MASYNVLPLLRKKHKLSNRKLKKLTKMIIINDDNRKIAMDGALSMGDHDLYYKLHNYGVDTRNTRLKGLIKI